jgi:hypothetical protein
MHRQRCIATSPAPSGHALCVPAGRRGRITDGIHDAQRGPIFPQHTDAALLQGNQHELDSRQYLTSLLSFDLGDHLMTLSGAVTT